MKPKFKSDLIETACQQAGVSQTALEAILRILELDGVVVSSVLDSKLSVVRNPAPRRPARSRRRSTADLRQMLLIDDPHEDP